MAKINIQVCLQGAHAEAFEKFKDRPIVGSTRKNTVALMRLIETTPEWEAVTNV